MSMLDCVLGIGNEGAFECGWFEDGIVWTIDNITLRMASGKRLRRYAVCVDRCWKSNEYMNLREARQKVEELRKLHKRFRPFTAEEMREYAKRHGNRAAHDLLLLGGYGFLEGTCRDYDELLKEFQSGVADHGNGSAEAGKHEV